MLERAWRSEVEYLDLADYVVIAAEVTGLEMDTVMNVADLNLADSAPHAPAAGFGDTDFSWTGRPSASAFF